MLNAVKVFPTEASHYDFWSQAFKSSAQHDADPFGLLDYQWPPESHGEQFLKEACAKVATPGAKRTCEGFLSDNGSLRRRQLEAVGGIFLIGAVAFAAVFLLGRLLDWVIAGFQRPSIPPQQ